MNSVNSKSVRRFTKSALAVSLVAMMASSAFAWEVDFSRRQTDFKRVSNQSRLPASVGTSEKVGLMEKVFEVAEPTQDLVILNTNKGFVPETVHLRKGGTYRVHIVNVNESEKNVSFVLDAFSEHHNTVFGKTRTFTISPKADGVFDFLCPETATQGRFVVAAPERAPASK